MPLGVNFFIFLVIVQRGNHAQEPRETLNRLVQSYSHLLTRPLIINKKEYQLRVNPCGLVLGGVREEDISRSMTDRTPVVISRGPPAV